jgi:hypothetical protein
MRAVVFECYLQHADPAAFPAFRKNSLLIDIGRIFSRIEQFRASNRQTELLEEVSDIFDTLPDLEFFEQLEKSCDDDIFLRQ